MQLTGIDFTGLEKFREAVNVTMPDGTRVELPLITLRDAPIATSYLRENDMLVTKFAMLSEKCEGKSKAIKEAAAEREGDDSDELTDTEITVLSNTAESLIDFQRENRELIKELNKLCDSIIAFIAPYFKDTKVIDCLKTYEARFTFKVLQLMLYGADAIKPASEEAESDKNPTETPSQNS